MYHMKAMIKFNFEYFTDSPKEIKRHMVDHFEVELNEFAAMCVNMEKACDKCPPELGKK